MAEIEFVEQSHEILEMTPDPIGAIARAARTCYRSEANASPEADLDLVGRLIRSGHHAMLEHAWLSVRFVTDRGVSHELVRHRLFSFAQESQRYCNYGRRGFKFIMPPLPDNNWRGNFEVGIRELCQEAADTYEAMVDMTLVENVPPETARAVLPNCTVTTIVVSGNMREWRHALALRCDPHAHPQIRALMRPLLVELRERVPVLFDDIEVVE